MQSGEYFNEYSKNCDFYTVSENEYFDPTNKLICNIRYIFDLVTDTTSENNYVHLVEIPNDAIVEFKINYYKSNKLNIKKTWKSKEFLKLNNLRIVRMMSNRNLFDQFDDISHMLNYNVQSV